MGDLGISGNMAEKCENVSNFCELNIIQIWDAQVLMNRYATLESASQDSSQSRAVSLAAQFSFWEKYGNMVSICFNSAKNLHLQTPFTFVVSHWFSVAGAHPGEWRFGAAIRWTSWRIHTDSHEIASCHDPLQWERKHESEVLERRYWSFLVDFCVYVFCIWETYQGKMSTWQLAVNYTSARPGLWHTSRALRSKGKMCSKLWFIGSQLLMLKLSERFVQVELEQHFIESQDWKQKVSKVLTMIR